MNYLVFLDAGAKELEKILSGVKTMVIRDVGSHQSTLQPVKPGDNLFLLRSKDERDLYVKATVKSSRLVSSGLGEEISHYLKEMQPKLQLTEEQYNYWSLKNQVVFIELECAQKVGVVHLTLEKVHDRPDWIAFEAFSVLP